MLLKQVAAVAAVTDPVSRLNLDAPVIGKGKGKVDDLYNSAINGMFLFIFAAFFQGY